MSVIRYISGGESHGKALTAIVEGFPAGLPVDEEFINNELKKRQGGYGRGKRMEIEQDRVEFLSGVRNGETLGSPITLTVINKDWENWEDIMSPRENINTEKRKILMPRPGHADLAGTIKYRHKDIRNTLERASARETAIRVAVGALTKILLNKFNISVLGHVLSVGSIKARPDYSKLDETIYNNPLYCTDEEATLKMMKLIDENKGKGDSLGGIIEIVVKNAPVGLGSHVHWDRRLDSRLAGALMSIQAIKGVEIGIGFSGAYLPGSKVHDEIFFSEEKGYYHETNNSGGIEGGISNGEPIIARAAMKPIPTLYSPLQSVDMTTKEKQYASIERSDICAVPAAAIVCEAVVAWEIAKCFLEKFSGDHINETIENYNNYLAYLR